MPKNDFENVMVRSFNKYFKNNNIDGIAFRMIESKYTHQIIDILVDSKNSKYYLAIEAKSTKGDKLYFKSHFVEGQIESENYYINKSGRTGYLAFEKRFGPGKPREAYLIPWKVVYERYKLFKETNNRLYNGFSYKEIQTIGKRLKREKGLYIIDNLQK